MPPRIPKVCRKRGCPHTTVHSHGYCDQHQSLAGWGAHQAGRSRHERGYGTDWDKLRRRILQRDRHLCQECLRQGRAVAAKTVDHIVPKARGGTDDDYNLQSLCWPCHRSKTACERLG